MSLQGIILIDLLALGLILLILYLVRTGRLYPGYATLWIASNVALMILVSLPPLLALVTRALGAVFPASALTLLAFFFVFLVLILFSVKLTVLAQRQTELIQILALRELLEKERKALEPEKEGHRELAVALPESVDRGRPS
jgi:hypothetical protein